MRNNSKEQIDFRKELNKILEDEEYVFDRELCNFTEEVILPNRKHLRNLYRYSPADYNNIRCLEKGTIYLAPIGSMNDIFEGLNCNIGDISLQSLNILTDLVYAKSFTEEKNNLLMWSMYADNFAGMCVEYRTAEICKKYLYHIFPIVYSDKIKFAKDIKEIITQHYHAKKEDDSCVDLSELKDIICMFLVKNHFWEREKEWRFVVPYVQMNMAFDWIGAKDDYDFCKEHFNIDEQEIPFDYVSAIYLGFKMPLNKQEHIMEIAKKHNQNGKSIKVYKTKISQSQKEFDFELIYGE